MGTSSEGTSSVHDAYEALGACVETYAKAAAIVNPYHRTTKQTGGYEELMAAAPDAARDLQGWIVELRSRFAVAKALAEPLRRDQVG